jgi:hypothetical protein
MIVQADSAHLTPAGRHPMSSAPQDGEDHVPPQLPRNRARLWIVLAVVAVLVIVFGYLLLVGGLAGD